MAVCQRSFHSRLWQVAGEIRKVLLPLYLSREQVEEHRENTEKIDVHEWEPKEFNVEY